MPSFPPMGSFVQPAPGPNGFGIDPPTPRSPAPGPNIFGLAPGPSAPQPGLTAFSGGAYDPTTPGTRTFFTSIDRPDINSESLFKDNIIILSYIYGIIIDISLPVDDFSIDTERANIIGQLQNKSNLQVVSRFIPAIISTINKIKCKTKFMWFVELIKHLKLALVNIIKFDQFTYKFDKLFINEIILPYVKKEVHQELIGEDQYWFDDNIDINSQIFFRDNDGRLYKQDINGNKILFDDPNIVPKSYENCYGTGIKESTYLVDGNEITGTCTNFIQDCMIGKNIDKCKTYFKNPNFWEITKKEIDDMHPIIADKMINIFELDKIYVYNKELNRNLLQVKPYDAWIEKLKNKITDSQSNTTEEDVKIISANSKLKYYIEYLIHKVNSEPAILNKDYTGPNIIDANRFVPPTRPDVSRRLRDGAFSFLEDFNKPSTVVIFKLFPRTIIS
jgi:hypothetical protein